MSTQEFLPLPLAQQLRDAGLEWRAGNHSFFAIPDRDLDESIFVITDMMATLAKFRGWPVVAFHGTAEWASDHILSHEVVWLPTESELRREVEDILLGEEIPQLALHLQHDGYRCEVSFRGETVTFDGKSASEAYAKTLLHLLEQTAS